jgi:hypothetical protein
VLWLCGYVHPLSPCFMVFSGTCQLSESSNRPSL